MTIVVTTPTGHVGSRVTTLLAQAGERPTVLLRDRTRLDAGLRELCDVVELDLGDADAVARATAGADALYWVDPPTTDDDPVAGHERMGASAAHAVRTNGIPRVVLQSSVGAEARHGFGDIDGLARTEELLDATGAHVTHLRCGYFFTNLLMDVDGLRSGTLTTTLPLDQPLPWVDPRDIGDVAAARVLSTTWAGRTTQGVHGPADLSFDDVARVLTDATGHTVVATRVTDEQVAGELRGFGLTDAQVDAVVGMSRGLRGDFVPEDRRSALTTTPTTLAAWAHEHLRPLLRPGQGPAAG
ncbi:NAD(P)H-binding protein [Cellulomonas cellasea]|uniref:NmrA family transcriptional regulator n=2 Tax=Cellulomonas cellasea TaxID=43670 RepID=A0A0A0B4M6_9CELL|nr:NAD(P)H-binding protein [Cellulomonas cellasea]KGM01107.1 NmrA family transcriptional regulator [Cellulomonas cellasea DSM 20118]GEA89111.1 NmrA family transcriptional regulator [Cellulomonas cellasea]